MLRALEGDEATVTHAIALMLECPQELEVIEGSVLENASVEKVVEMIQNSSSSHLMEVSPLYWEDLGGLICESELKCLYEYRTKQGKCFSNCRIDHSESSSDWCLLYKS
jgi:hypothetical protein